MLLSTYFRYLLLSAALVVCAPMAYAQTAHGDYWIIYGQGEGRKNEMYVADATGILQKPGGVLSLLILHIFQDVTMPAFAAYEVEVKCSQRQTRLTSAKVFNRIDLGVREAPFSPGWRGVEEYWLQRTFAFACAPGNRTNNQMLSAGKMDAGQMINLAQQMFIQQAPLEQRDQTLKDLDEMLGNTKP